MILHRGDAGVPAAACAARIVAAAEVIALQELLQLAQLEHSEVASHHVAIGSVLIDAVPIRTVRRLDAVQHQGKGISVHHLEDGGTCACFPAQAHLVGVDVAVAAERIRGDGFGRSLYRGLSPPQAVDIVSGLLSAEHAQLVSPDETIQTIVGYQVPGNTAGILLAVDQQGRVFGEYLADLGVAVRVFAQQYIVAKGSAIAGDLRRRSRNDRYIGHCRLDVLIGVSLADAAHRAVGHIAGLPAALPAVHIHMMPGGAVRHIELRDGLEQGIGRQGHQDAAILRVGICSQRRLLHCQQITQVRRGDVCRLGRRAWRNDRLSRGRRGRNNGGFNSRHSGRFRGYLRRLLCHRCFGRSLGLGRLCRWRHGGLSRRLFHRRFRRSFSHRGRRRFGCGLGRRRGGERGAYIVALLLIIKGDEFSHDESRGPIDNDFIPELVLAVDGLRKHPHLSALFEGSELLSLPARGITELDLSGVCFAPEVHCHVFRGQDGFSGFRFSRNLYAKRFQLFCVQRLGHRLFDKGLIVLELDLVPFALVVADQNAQGHDHFILHHLSDNIGCISGGGARCGAYIHIILIGVHIYVFNRGALPDRAFRLGAGLGLNGFFQPVEENDL